MKGHPLTFPHVVQWVICVAQAKQDIEKRFSASLKGVESEAFSVKNLAFKIFIFNLCQIFKISCFIIFIDVWHLCYQLYSVTLSCFVLLYSLLCRYPQSECACL